MIAAFGIPSGPTHAQTTLREAAAKGNLNFGAAVGSIFYGGSSGAYRDVLRREFNMAVCENEMKFGSVEPSRGNFNFSKPDQLVQFAADNDIIMRGHTLIWHNQSGWAGSANVSRAEMLKIMNDHITAVLTHYAGKILEWDVVNEAIADGSMSLRNSFWRQRIGDDYLDSAFTFAHRADPAAFLYYNDYNAEGMNTKANGVYEMVKRMKENGIPIHGVGLQCHFGASINRAEIDMNIKRLGALGLRVSITELDMMGTSSNAKPWTDILGACLDNANCTSFLTWGIHDAQSWKGGGCGCLLFDGQLLPKSALVPTLISAMENADPAISAARKAFAQKGTVALGKPGFPAGESFRYARGAFHFSPGWADKVVLRVYRTDGGLVFSQARSGRGEGLQAIPWSPAGIPAGMYLARLQVGGKELRILPVAVGPMPGP